MTDDFERALWFDEKAHKYYVDGNEVPSVSRVLQYAGAVPNYGAIAADVMEVARDRGNIVHEIIHKHHTEGCSLTAVDEKSNACLRAYEAFLRETCYESIETEVRLVSWSYGYAGTLDGSGFLFGNRALIDVKTTSQIHIVPVEMQTAAYENLYHENREHRIDKRFVLQLKKNGRYNLVECVDQMAFDKFVYALQEMKAEAP